MNNLLQAKKRTNTEESRIRINEKIANIQATLANELEMKEKAKQLRINNFYRTNMYRYWKNGPYHLGRGEAGKQK